jgi:hypothetical protein
VKSQTPSNSPTDRDSELAELRAEVARVLSADTPDLAALTAALERVEDMLNVARAELACAVREIDEQCALEHVQRRSEPFAHAEADADASPGSK